MSEWQPIETAPKDGTAIDLWVADRRLPNGYVIPAKRIPNCSYREPQWNGDRPGWTWHESSDECDSELNADYTPTHWMPLPAPPETANQRNND